MNDVNDRIEYLTLESDAPGFLRVFALALPPAHAGKDGSKKLIAIILAVALLAGLVLPVTVDLFDERVHDAIGAERALGFARLA
jgi:succinoglycan biosynthesis transport protein ExoP